MTYPTLEAARAAAEADEIGFLGGNSIFRALDGAGYGLSFGDGSHLEGMTVFAGGCHHEAEFVEFVPTKAA